MKTSIYRAVVNKPDSNITMPKSSMRAPGNVPYIVDNLWEWKRPESLPNRRHAAFASPRPDLAINSVAANATAYRVELQGITSGVKVAQLMNNERVINPQDSKYHPECKSLTRLAIKLLDPNWIGCAPLQERQADGMAALWMPCLTRQNMDAIFQSSKKLAAIREELFEAICYWDDVHIIDDLNDLPGDEGEIFFEYPNGYRLISL